MEHAGDAVVRFRNKVFLKKIESNAWEFNGFFITKQIENLDWLCYVVKHSGSG